MSLRAFLIVLSLLLATAAAQAQSPEAGVTAAAEVALAEAWPDLAARAEVEVVRLSPAVAAAAGPLRVRFEAPPRGRTSAVVEGQTETGWARLGWAYLHVAHRREVAVLTRDVARGEALDGAVRTETRETTALRGALAPEAVGPGAVARRTLRAGTVLTDRLVAAPAAATIGAPVAVTYTRGTLRLTVVGEARERGALGDEVRVYVPDTRSTFRVRLTGPGAGAWVATL
ncbi:MAG: flagellar basal body P-ring formation chaperone FlgA [Bacteroidota bacterium]